MKNLTEIYKDVNEKSILRLPITLSDSIVVQGNNIGSAAKKIMDLTLYDTQVNIKNLYLNEITKCLEDLNLNELQIKALIDNLHRSIRKKHKIEFDFNVINHSKLQEFSKLVISRYMNKIENSSKSLAETWERDFNKTGAYKIFIAKEKINEKNFIELLKDIFDLKKEEISKNYEAKYVHFTGIAKLLKTNQTNLKNELEEVEKISLKFNYLDRFDDPVEVSTHFFQYFKFFKKNGKTIMEYAVSQPVLEMMIIPEFFASLDLYVILYLKKIESHIFYSLIKSFDKSGNFVLTKKQIEEIFKVAPSYLKNRADLKKHLLDKVKKELKGVNIDLNYSFNKSTGWDKIYFDFEINEAFKPAPMIDEASKLINVSPNEEEFSETVKLALMKLKYNPHIPKKNFNKYFDEKLKSILKETSENTLLMMIDMARNSITKPLEKSLTVYFNGIIRNLKKQGVYYSIPKGVDADSIIKSISANIKVKPKKKSMKDSIEYKHFLSLSLAKQNAILLEAVQMVYKNISNIKDLSAGQKRSFNLSKTRLICRIVKERYFPDKEEEQL